MTTPTIAVLVVAYNAQDTLEAVLDRIPTSFISEISTVLVCDDASTDATTAVVTNYMAQSRLPITVVTHPINRGYGGNQKFGYQWAIEHDLDIVRAAERLFPHRAPAHSALSDAIEHSLHPDHDPSSARDDADPAPQA